MKALLVLLPSLLLLSACVTPTTIVKPLDTQHQGNRNINYVNVSYSELSKDKITKMDNEAIEEGREEGTLNELKHQPLHTSMAYIVKESLEKVDNDSGFSTNIEIEVDNLQIANPLAMFLVGDNDQLTGTVKVYDTQTKQLLTEFYVDHLKPQGGLLDMAIRGTGVREKMSAQFAEYIAEQMGFEKP